MLLLGSVVAHGADLFDLRVGTQALGGFLGLRCINGSRACLGGLAGCDVVRCNGLIDLDDGCFLVNGILGLDGLDDRVLGFLGFLNGHSLGRRGLLDLAGGIRFGCFGGKIRVEISLPVVPVSP